MKNLSIKIAAMCFMAIVACPCVMADEKIDLDMVKIPGKNFEMLRTEVTQELYEAVMGVNPSYFCHDNKKLDEGSLRILNKSTSNCPVEYISWYDAIYFCNKLSEKEGLQPVYAVDGETSIRKWGYEPHNKDKIDGVITQDIFANGYRLPTVEEWCWDSYGSDNRYNCGSSWYNCESNCKVDNRKYGNAGGRYPNQGFRIVRTIKYKIFQKRIIRKANNNGVIKTNETCLYEN